MTVVCAMSIYIETAIVYFYVFAIIIFHVRQLNLQVCVTYKNDIEEMIVTYTWYAIEISKSF